MGARMATLFYLQPLHFPQGLDVLLPQLLHLFQVFRVRQGGLLKGQSGNYFHLRRDSHMVLERMFGANAACSSRREVDYCSDSM